MKIFMTGANGAVGSALLARLLEMGHQVTCLLRPKAGKSGLERLQETIGKLPIACDVVDGDICMPDCGILQSQTEVLSQTKFDLVLHCAASVKMDPLRNQEIWNTNVVGTQNVVALAKRLGIAGIHLVSTAYVENGRSNMYEISKAEAEEIVRQSGLHYTISRISIVIGDSKTGVIHHSFSGCYGFLLPFWLVAQRLRQEQQLEDSVVVAVPVSVKVLPTAVLNLIPLEWTSKMLAAITEKALEGRTLSVTHPHPPLTIDAINFGLSALRISGVRFSDATEGSGIVWPREKAVFRQVMKLLAPYVTKPTAFDNRSLREYLGSQYEDPPHITPQLIRTVMLYAEARNFGVKIPAETMQ